MGSPVSNTRTEIFLQYIEDTYLKQLLDTKNIILYTRYIDDILLINDTKCINSNTIHEYITQIYPNLQLNSKHANNNCINFLDLLIIRNPTNLEIDIYRKPTTTDITINFLSNHPTKHKIAAYRYHITRMQSLPLTTERQQSEWKTIQAMARNNNFPEKLITNLKTQMQQKNPPKTG